jgi:hypothetical protein
MVPCGQGWFAPQGMEVHTAASWQKPHSQWPVAALQAASATPVQPCGHCPLKSKHPAPGHSQHTGGATQSHLSGAVR